MFIGWKCILSLSPIYFGNTFHHLLFDTLLPIINYSSNLFNEPLFIRFQPILFLHFILMLMNVPWVKSFYFPLQTLNGFHYTPLNAESIFSHALLFGLYEPFSLIYFLFQLSYDFLVFLRYLFHGFLLFPMVIGLMAWLVSL